MPCTGVHNVFSDWKYNAFIYAPVYSSLVLTAGGVETMSQQNMVDAAGSLVNNIPSGLSYYSRCWSIIGILTLNGDVSKAAINIGISGPTSTPSPTPLPTPSPTVRGTASPTSAPTRTTSLRPSPSSTATGDDDDEGDDDQIDTLSSLIKMIMPLLNAIIPILNGLLGLFN